MILDPNSSNRGIKIRINSTVQTGFVPGMLLSPLGDLSHIPILYYYEITKKATNTYLDMLGSLYSYKIVLYEL
jgi:hypothetical protein